MMTSQHPESFIIHGVKMLEFKFSNYTGETVGFRFYEKYVWRDKTTMTIRLADASAPVSLRFDLQKMKKDFKDYKELVRAVKVIFNLISPNYPEGSPGFQVEFSNPEEKPELKLEGFIPYMQEGDEQLINISFKNLEGKPWAEFEGDCAIMRKGWKLKAIRQGVGFVKYGVGNFSRTERLTVEGKPEEVTE